MGEGGEKIHLGKESIPEVDRDAELADLIKSVAEKQPAIANAIAAMDESARVKLETDLTYGFKPFINLAPDKTGQAMGLLDEWNQEYTKQTAASHAFKHTPRTRAIVEELNDI